MKVLFDTNVVLDLLLKRELFYPEAYALISKVELGEIHGVLCATTVTTIHYFVEKQQGREAAKRTIGSLLKLFEVASVNRSVLTDALDINDRDFEDSVVYKSAYYAGADFIVTRDQSGFKKSGVRTLSPRELLDIIGGV